MSTKLFNKFWVTVTAVITLGLLAYLFPLLLNKYGLVKALLLACLIPVAMTMPIFEDIGFRPFLIKSEIQPDKTEIPRLLIEKEG